MAQPSPETIANELIQRINVLWQQKYESGRYDDIEFKHIEHVIDKLYNVNNILADTTKAMLYCVAGNEQVTRRLHERATHESNNHPDVVSNYVVSLHKLERNKEALDLADTIYQNKTHDEDFLKLIVRLAEKAGDKNKFEKYLEFYERVYEKEIELDPFPEDEDEPLEELITSIEEKMTSDSSSILEVDENEFQNMLNLAKEIEEKS